MSFAFSDVMASPPRLHCRHTRVSAATDESLTAIRERVVGGLAGDFYGAARATPTPVRLFPVQRGKETCMGMTKSVACL